MRSRRAARRSLGVLLACGLVAAACTGDDSGAGSTTTQEAVEPVVLRLGVTDLAGFDPVDVVPTVHGQMIVADLLYDSLTVADPDTGEVQPSLAESWEPDDELRVWTITLGDATFTDGSPVTAADAKASLERVAQPGPASLAGVRLEVVEGYDEFVAGEADDISGVEVIDNRTLRITTAEPYSPLPELLATPLFGVLPADLVDTAGFFDLPVGSGPLRLDDVSAPGPATDGSSPPASQILRFEAVAEDLGVDFVELYEYATIEDSYEAFRSGDVDWSLVPGDELDAAVDEYGEGAVAPFHAEVFYGFNVGGDTFRDRMDLRQAVVQAVDRERLVAELYPAGFISDGVVAEGVPGSSDTPCGTSCAYAPEVSEVLLNRRFKDGEVSTVNLDFYEGELERATAEAIAADLEVVGIPVELQPREFENYREFVVSSDQTLFLFGWVGIVPTADGYLAPMFTTEAGDNVTAFTSEAFDEAIADARGIADPDERAAAFGEAEELLMSRFPVMPLVQFKTGAVVSDRVDGWTPMLDGTFVVTEVGIVE